eukprot:jgi/Psemu1/45540/gm1.45540_g
MVLDADDGRGRRDGWEQEGCGPQEGGAARNKTGETWSGGLRVAHGWASLQVSSGVDDFEEVSQTAITTNGELGVQPVPQGAGTKAHAANPKANPTPRKHPFAASVSSPDLSHTNTKAAASLSEEDLDYQQHRKSVEKNLGLALNGQTYANMEFVKALSLDATTSFTQLMTKVYIVSKNIQSEPMPNFRTRSSTESWTKKKKKKKKRKKEFVEYVWSYTLSN